MGGENPPAKLPCLQTCQLDEGDFSVTFRDQRRIPLLALASAAVEAEPSRDCALQGKRSGPVWSARALTIFNSFLTTEAIHICERAGIPKERIMKMRFALKLVDPQGVVVGYLGLHIDDVITGGVGSFYEEKIQNLRAKYPFGSWACAQKEMVVYCGCEIEQDAQGRVHLRQERFSWLSVRSTVLRNVPLRPRKT